MRRRRRKPGSFHEPSLVPLADMLTNTVGIMVFILIFTVLTAGGAVVPKRLPMEQSSAKQRLTFVCLEDRVLRLDEEGLIDRFMEPVGRPALSVSAEWIRRFRERRLDGADYLVTGAADTVNDSFLVRAGIEFQTRSGRGDGLEALRTAAAAFPRVLSEHSPDEYYLYFLVYPDSIAVHAAARELAAAAGYQTGWSPESTGEPIRFTIFTLGSGGGIPLGPQN